MKKYSFYYRDSIDLRLIYPEAYCFSLLYPDDNIVINNGVMSLTNPERFNPLRIHNIVRVYLHKYDYFKIEVSIRCWKEDGPTLKEVTPLRKIITTKILSSFRRLLRKFGCLPKRIYLQTIDGSSYFYNRRRLERRGVDGNNIIGLMPQLQSPIYNEFIVVGEEAFLRTGSYLYKSENKMQNWCKIYEGKRGIKDSMIWIEEDNSLLFLEYSPGLEQSRHHIYKYFPATREIKTVCTFYSADEHTKYNKEPYCRHIHVMARDPYSNYIFLGVGDADNESAIYISQDCGNHFSLIGKGAQKWRTLAFLFTQDFVYWNTDSPDPQYISCINRTQLNNIPLTTQDLLSYPLYNGACWNAFYDNDTNGYIMASSCEGQIYDDKSRIVGVNVENGKPIVYNLFTDSEINNHPNGKYQQLFVLGKDIEGNYWFYDICRYCYRIFKMKK